MKTAGTKEYLYFLTVKEAMKIAKEHEKEDWDIWKDQEAIIKGWGRYYTKEMYKGSRSAS